MGSETTAAATGAVGQVRRDPMAMLPFCGYHMGDYFRHWIRMQRELAVTPRIFHVNWFRKDADGKFLWPGFSENMRVLAGSWTACTATRMAAKRRSAGCRATRISTGRGWISRASNSMRCMAVDRAAWRKEVMAHEELFINLHDQLPPEMIYERELLICRL